MPLRDHFHPPLSPGRSWESFHSRWANTIGDALNRVLPRRYVAEINMQLGTQVAADVAEWERLDDPSEEATNGPGGVAVHAYAPPAAALVMPVVFSDEIEVQIIDQSESARLVAVVELISPRNKDSAEASQVFAGKCAAYLQRSIGLIVADVVSNRTANLHNELMQLFGQGEPYLLPDDALLYAVAYRPVQRQKTDQVELWPVPLTVGATLPTLPLALRGGRPVPVDLEATYTVACERSRM